MLIAFDSRLHYKRGTSFPSIAISTRFCPMKLIAIKEAGRFARSVERLLLPATCLACHDLLDVDTTLPVCEQCQQGLQSGTSPRCLRCGARFPNLGHSSPVLEKCRFCRDLDIPISSTVCIGNYESAMRSLVIRMKNRGHEPLAIQFGRWLGLEWNRLHAETGPVPDLITPVSVHWLRRIRRGYNVAELLCEGLARTIDGNPQRITVLKTVRATKKQGTLTTKQRFENVKNCFSVRLPQRVDGKSVLLVDDVMTSGATAIQAARALQQAGARSVYLAIVARGVGGRS